MKIPEGRLGTITDIALIVAAWCGGVLIVNPIGNFPLYDDWAFSRTVAHLLSTGEYDSLNWGWMTLVTNVLWGALFSLPDGFSFTALRISTLVAAVIGLIGVYVLFRDLRQSRCVALLAVSLTGFNPYFFSLSHSFMTEALFTALLVWASVFLVRSLRTESNLYLIVGTLLALAGTLSRQLALCVPLAFAATQLLKSGIRPPSVLRALTPVAVCVGAYIAVLWAGMIGANVNMLIVDSLSDVHKVSQTVIYNIYITLIHSGLLLLPILLVDTVDQWRRQAARVISIGGMSIMIIVLIVVAKAYYGPFGGEIALPLSGWLVKSGIGPVWLYDFPDNDSIQPLPRGFWIIVTSMALAGSVMLITAFVLRITELIHRIARHEAMADASLVTSFSALTVIIYFLLLLTSPVAFDRHVVPMIPFIAMTIVGFRTSPASTWFNAPPLWRVATWTLIALFGFYAVVGTRDYLTCNRVRWMALNELMQDRQIPPDDIDGGFEFNFLYLWSTDHEANEKLVKRPAIYLVTFGLVPNYTVVKEYSYQHWLPWHRQTILVLRKQQQ